LNGATTDQGLHVSQILIVKGLVSDMTQAWERTENERERERERECVFPVISDPDT